MKTNQNLVCTCPAGGGSCSGRFRVGFDGEMSVAMAYDVTSSTLVANMNALRTMESALANAILSGASATVCGNPGTTTTTTIILKAPAGNLPRLSICKII